MKTACPLVELAFSLSGADLMYSTWLRNRQLSKTKVTATKSEVFEWRNSNTAAKSSNRYVISADGKPLTVTSASKKAGNGSGPATKRDR